MRALYEGEDAEAPPELCAACAIVSSPRARLARAAWGGTGRSDPHGDCPNYC